MKHLVIYIHGKGGSAAEAEHYRSLFPDSRVVGFAYEAQTPWAAEEEFAAFIRAQRRGYDSLTLVANSIGAFFSMHALDETLVDNALFISPVVDMEQLIAHMMTWAGVTEEELRERREIPTSFGETLSWDYLYYVRSHPIYWRVPTCILYGSEDNLTSRDTIAAFAGRIHAPLTVMEGGEHWFHTPDQMAFLDRWVTDSMEAFAHRGGPDGIHHAPGFAVTGKGNK